MAYKVCGCDELLQLVAVNVTDSANGDQNLVWDDL